MITVVVGKEIEKIKGDFESYLNGLNMVGEISYSQYSELYDEGVKQIQRAYELGKSELEKENAELKERVKTLTIHDTNAVLNGLEMKVLKDSHRDRANKTQEQLTKAKKLIEKLLIVSCNSEVLIQYPNCKEVLEARVALEQFLREG